MSIFQLPRHPALLVFQIGAGTQVKLPVLAGLLLGLGEARLEIIAASGSSVCGRAVLRGQIVVHIGWVHEAAPSPDAINTK